MTDFHLLGGKRFRNDSVCPKRRRFSSHSTWHDFLILSIPRFTGLYPTVHRNHIHPNVVLSSTFIHRVDVFIHNREPYPGALLHCERFSPLEVLGFRHSPKPKPHRQTFLAIPASILAAMDAVLHLAVPAPHATVAAQRQSSAKR